eukprot:gene12275-13421_t
MSARFEDIPQSIDEDETINIFEKSHSLSSSLSDQQLKAKLSVHTFYPKFHPTPSMMAENQTLSSKSEDTQVEQVKQVQPKPKKVEKFQTLDEIFEELDVSKEKKMPVSALKKEKKAEKAYDSDGSSDGSQRGSISMSSRRKSISWRYSRTPSPVPPSAGRKSRGSSPVPMPLSRRASRTPSPVPRSMSEPIRVPPSNSQPTSPTAAEGSPPPLPYNIRTKKRVARRIQSIHHMAEPGSAVPSSSDPEHSEQEKSVSSLRNPIPPPPPPAPVAPPATVSTDPGTTSDSGSSWRRSMPTEGDETSSVGTPTILSKGKTLLVPCRLNENALLDLSMLPKPFTVKDQLRLAMLLSTQESKYGFNMFDSLIPGDNEEITRLMSMGIRYEDAVLIIFEKRYVTKPHEGLRTSPMPIPEYKPHALASIPAPAAAQLGEELARSLSPKPRPQSMPITSHRGADYYNDVASQNSRTGLREVATPRGYSRESSVSPHPRHHSIHEMQGYHGDYGLHQQQYPGYVTTSRGMGSVDSSRAHSPHPNDVRYNSNANSNYYRYYPGSSLETSRTITPNPPFAHLERPPPLTSLHMGNNASNNYGGAGTNYSSRNQSPHPYISRNQSPHAQSSRNQSPYKGGPMSPTTQYAIQKVPPANVVRVDPYQSQVNTSMPVSRGVPLPMMGKVSQPKQSRGDILL